MKRWNGLAVLSAAIALVLVWSCLPGRTVNTAQAVDDGSGNRRKGVSVTNDSTLKTSDIDRMPFVEIAAAPQYYIGLPIIISVTWDNRSGTAQYLLLPPLDLTFSQGGDIVVSVVPTGSEGARLETGFARGEEGSPVVALGPREKRRMVCDLSNMGVLFQPGSYDVTLTLRQSYDSRTSNKVHIQLMDLSETDQREASRLRKLGNPGFDTGAWAHFLEINLNTVKVKPSFDAHAREQLALHLFLHRATWTPATLADVDPVPLGKIHGAHVDAEVAVLKYELMHARKDPHLAEERRALLVRFPGLEHRLQATDRGEGTLANYRKTYGIEDSFPKPPAHWPYRP